MKYYLTRDDDGYWGLWHGKPQMRKNGNWEKRKGGETIDGGTTWNGFYKFSLPDFFKEPKVQLCEIYEIPEQELKLIKRRK